MKLVFSLAKNSNPFPNPRVGALIVKKRKIIGKGYHKKAGMPHAEIEAIKDAERKGHNIRGATLYLTLEPCCHNNKRTPPCTKAIIRKGLSKVVCAMRDPNPAVRGKGIEELRKNGICTEVGLLREDAVRINRKYIRSMTKGLPYVAVKMAMTLDGKIATETGESKWISGYESRKFVQKLRSEFDAVMVGAETVLTDNPSLTCRLKKRTSPVKIIVDSRLRTPLNSKLFNSGKAIFLTTEKFNRKKRKTLEKAGVKFVVAGEKKVDLGKALKKVLKLGILSVLVEGGGELNGSLFREGLIDHIYFFMAPKLIGGKNAKTPIEGNGIKKLKDAVSLKDIKIKETGRDFLFEADLVY